MNQTTSDTSSTVRAISLTGKPISFPGYVFGFHQPTLCYQIHIESCNPSNLSSIDDFVKENLHVVGDLDDPDNNDPVIRRLKHWPSALLKQKNHPIFESVKILRQNEKQPNHYTIIQPCFDHRAALSAVVFFTNLLAMASREAGIISESFKKFEEIYNKLQEHLAGTGLQGFNPIHFLSAASDLGIPWYRLKDNIFQLGIGRNSRWIDSSFTDETPVLSTMLARNKQDTARILRTSGFPVPQQFPVKTEEEAIHYAEKLGYPVVIKPANLDGGRGVKANLQAAQTVCKAFEAAAKLSKRVLVEKHVPGRDYRIQVVNCEVQGVLERVPGGVTGNGTDSIQSLLERQNHERKIAEDDRRFLHQMAFDEEAKEQLTAQNLDWNAVPMDGQFVRLRGACNVASGGIPIPVPLDQVHPDNLYLALRAARILRLDVAGIDLLMPDIQRSWVDTGAYICEINAQPQMFTTLHKPMLVSMFKGKNGRIPVVIIVEEKYAAANISFSIQSECLKRGINSGLVSGKEVWIGENCVNKACGSAVDGTMMLLLDKSVEVMIIHITENEFIHKGWPVDLCDVLVFGTQSFVNTDKNSAHIPGRWLILAKDICPGFVVIEDADPNAPYNATTIFNHHNIANAPCWAEESRRSPTVTKIVDELVSGV
jgi:cyanophycin synthetase